MHFNEFCFIVFQLFLTIYKSISIDIYKGIITFVFNVSINSK